MVSSCSCRLAPELSHKRASKPPHESGPTTSLAPRPSPALAEGHPLQLMRTRTLYVHSSHARAAELADNASFIQLPSQCLGKRMSRRATWVVTRTTPAGVAASGEAPRPDVVGGSEGTAKCFCDCDPCRELQARSLPRQPRHIPTRAHTHPAHSPAASSPPPPRARPPRPERERAREAAGWRVPGVHR